MKNQYRQLNDNRYYIDKTAALEKGIERFLSIYIEAAAVSGKTTAVQMLLARHPEIEEFVLDGRYEIHTVDEWKSTLEEVCIRMEKRACWLIIENINHTLSEEKENLLTEFVLHMPENGRVIFVGRERPGKAFLKLFWERKMEIIPREALLFTKEEIRQFCAGYNSLLSATDLYNETGGWAGCVDSMIRLASYYKEYAKEERSVSELRKTYEIEGYIQKEILESLSTEEYELVRRGRECPWLNGILCQEVWGLENAEEMLKKLERKGIFQYHKQQKHWIIFALFRYEEIQEQATKPKDWEILAEWYEENGFIKEAVFCFQKSEKNERYQKCIIENYDQISYSQILQIDMQEWKGNELPLCYLRGIHAYVEQDFKGLEREIAHIEKQNDREGFLKKEILLNLYYLKPDFSLDDWLTMLENADENHYRLYHMLGGGHTYLCGIRDLTGLFACSKKEENRKAKLWKARFGDKEWKYYQFARLDYYLETERQKSLRKEDYELLLEEPEEEAAEEIGVKLYLLGRMQRIEPNLGVEEYLKRLERKYSLNERNMNQKNVYKENVEAVGYLYSSWMNNPEKLTLWLKYSEFDTYKKVTEENYFKLCCMAKGYIFVNQYEKANRILRYVIPYLREYRRQRGLAELLFQQAITNWADHRHGQALQNVIESFLVSGNARYVDFYSVYGKKGKEVLEIYIDYMKTSSPEGWHRKKKYQYGNVLQMPVEDYMEVILRSIRHKTKASQLLSEEEPRERLTMMETIILQDISRGLSNNEMCEELNLKLPTVKSHIYSLYKKLGVNSRVQAILKGKELGILN